VEKGERGGVIKTKLKNSKLAEGARKGHEKRGGIIILKQNLRRKGGRKVVLQESKSPSFEGDRNSSRRTTSRLETLSSGVPKRRGGLGRTTRRKSTPGLSWVERCKLEKSVSKPR